MLIITRKPGQIIRVELAADTDPATPIGEVLAEGAIEIIVAQVHGAYVKLGVAAPLALAVRRTEP